MPTSRLKPLILLIFFCLILCACGTAPEQKIEGANINGTIDEAKPGVNMNFIVPVSKLGDPVGIDFRGTVSQGDFRAELRDAQGQVVWSKSSGPGTFSFNETLTNLPAGEYHLGTVWDQALKVQYELTWKPHAITPPAFNPLAFLPGLGMLLVGLVFFVLAVLRKAGWRYILLGSVAWVVTVSLKFMWAIPVNPLVYKAIGTWDLLFDLYVGALTGIFEVGVAYLFLRFTRFGKATWPQALGFGMAFGAIEAVLLSVNVIISAFIMLVSPQVLPLTAQQSFASLTLLTAAAPVWERLFTILVHIFSNVLIFYAILKRQPLAFWGAFLYKTLIDSVAAYAQMNGVANNSSLLVATELIIAVFGLIGYFGIRRLEKVYQGPENAPLPAAQNPEY